MERYTQQVKEIIERSRREEESLLTDAGKAAIEIVKFYKEKGFKEVSFKEMKEVLDVAY